MLDSRFSRRLSAAALAFVAWSFPSLADARGTSAASDRAKVTIPAAATSGAVDLSSVHIDNFGRINEHYFRGAQPEAEDYRALAAIGVKTVIDLQADGRSDEAGLVKAAGMTFYRIPMTTTDRPSAGAVSRFLELVNNPANQPVYVHCAGGRHRTGTMTAVYRMTQDHWTADQAYNEMKQYRFEGFPGHPVLKKFVYDYPKTLAPTTAVAATSSQQQ